MSGSVGSGGFAASYQNPQFAPQGLFGSLLGTLAGPAGSALGNIFGHQQLGSQIGSTVGQFAHLLPFAAGPQQAIPQIGQQQQLDPQSLANIVAMIRQAAQSAQQGLQILDTVHRAAPGLLPFALAPEQQQQQASGQEFAPQGLFGSILGKIAAPAGGVIGGLLGNRQLGTRIGSTAGQFAHLLPFAAGPQQAGQVADGQQQLDPQSLGTLVNIIRQAVQAAQQGLQILDAVQKAAPGLLPLALGPDQQQQQQQVGGPEVAPQGLFGSILGKIAAPAGGVIGGLLGNKQLGTRIGSTAGQFAHLLPFAAGPQQEGQVTDGQQQLDPQSLANIVAMIRQAAQAAQQGLQILDTVHKAAPGLLPFALAPDQQQQQAGTQQMAPQGLFGDLLGKVAGTAGGALGGLFGHQQLGTQIGNVAGQFAHLLPFAAGPQAGNSVSTLH